jgi:hypothetical protein
MEIISASMVTAGHSIDSVQGTSAGHRLPAMAFRWRADGHRSIQYDAGERMYIDNYCWQSLASCSSAIGRFC